MVMVGHPLYAGKTLLVLRVTNVGKRPVTITTMGAIRFHPLTSFVAISTVPQLPCELTEGKYIESIWPEAELDYATIDYWGAWDSRGEKHVLREASYLRHWTSAFQRRLQRKPASV
jgi:hypothetical protein